jgi:hypothetical protein
MSASSAISLHQDGKTSPTGTVTSNHSSSETLPGHYDIPYLEDDGSNYVFWKSIVQTILELRDLWPVVDGTAVEPDKTTSPDTHAVWYRKDAEARIRIMLMLKRGPRGPLNSVLSATCAKDCWDKLSAWYKIKAFNAGLRLLPALFQKTLSDTEPLEPQIDSLVRNANALINFGMFSDKWVPCLILMSLPPPFSKLKEIIIHNEPASGFNLETVISQISLDEQRRICKSGLGATTYFSRAAAKAKPKPSQEEERPKTLTSLQQT